MPYVYFIESACFFFAKLFQTTTTTTKSLFEFLEFSIKNQICQSDTFRNRYEQNHLNIDQLLSIEYKIVEICLTNKEMLLLFCLFFFFFGCYTRKKSTHHLYIMNLKLVGIQISRATKRWIDFGFIIKWDVLANVCVINKNALYLILP